MRGYSPESRAGVHRPFRVGPVSLTGARIAVSR